MGKAHSNFYYWMKKKFIYGLLLFSAIILQTAVLPVISFGFATGDILLMIILAGAILDGFSGFLGWAVFAGIIYDLVSYTAVGVHVLVFIFVVYFVSFFSRRFSVELRGFGLALFMIFVIVSTLVSHVILTAFAEFNKQSGNFYLRDIIDFKVVGIQILYDVILFFCCFIILRKAKKFFSIN